MLFLTPSPLRGYPRAMLEIQRREQLQAVLEVIEALGGVPLDAKLQFLLGRKGSLGGLTPVEALERGQLEKVRDVALAFAESTGGPKH